MQQQLGCEVYALDPTVKHKELLAPRVHFFRWGAPVVQSHLYCPVVKFISGGRERARLNCSELARRDHVRVHNWTLISPMALLRERNVRNYSMENSIAILKMDCEGCEYSLYNSSMADDPDFFSRVDQLILEVHLSQLWAPSNTTFLEYGRLLALLRRAGHALYDAQLGYCSGGEPMGVLPLVRSSGYMQRSGQHCENLLFSRTAGSKEDAE